MNTLTVRDVGTFGKNFGQNRGFGRYGMGQDANGNGAADNGNGAADGGNGNGNGNGNGAIIPSNGNGANKIISTIKDTKVMGIPIWMVGIGGAAAWYLLRK